MTRGRLLGVGMIVVAMFAVGCSAAPDRPNASDVTRTTSTAVASSGGSATWQRVDAPSTCMCSDASEFHYFIRRADPTKVLFFLEGGGACFSATTCAPDSASFTHRLTARNRPGKAGIFDLGNERNPFRDYSMVYVPYCTGDVHLGNATHDYGDGVVIHHNGYVNASTALAATAATFPDARQVVVVGASAGSAGAPLYGGLTHDVLPKAKITVLADSSAAYPGTRAITQAIGSLWGTTDAIPPWPENAGIDDGNWSLPGLFIQAHKHDPQIVFGRHDYAFDATQAMFSRLVGVSADDLVSLIDANAKLVEDGGVDLHTYVAPGSTHTVVQKRAFYTEEVEGVRFRDWVAKLVAGKDVPDVHCTDCHTSG
jgi:hypothetical protein